MTSRRRCSSPTASSCSRAGPPRSSADIDVAAELGPERPLEIRETQKFFELRNDVLHLIRNETGSGRMSLSLLRKDRRHHRRQPRHRAWHCKRFAAAGARLHLIADDAAVHDRARELGASSAEADITDRQAVARGA